MSFQIAPEGLPEPSGEFPTYLQIMFNGTPLGGPDVTVLDFVGDFVLTRGTGVDANKITIEAT